MSLPSLDQHFFLTRYLLLQPRQRARELSIHSAGLVTRSSQAPPITCHGSRGPRGNSSGQQTAGGSTPALGGLQEYRQSPEEAGALRPMSGEAEQLWAEKGQEATLTERPAGPRPGGVTATALLSGTRAAPHQAQGLRGQLAVLCAQVGSGVMFTP